MSDNPSGSRDPNAPTRLTSYAAAAVVLTLLADWLFYGRPIGWTLGGFVAALLVALAVTGGLALRRTSVWVSGAIAALLVITLIDEPGPLRVTIALAALATLALTMRLGWTNDPVRWAGRVGRLAATGWLRGPVDFITMRRWTARTDTPPRVCTPRIGPWVGPIAMSAVFVALFAIANPVIERWVSTAGSWIARTPELIELGRMLFWSIMLAAIWSLLRARPIGGRARRRAVVLGAPGVLPPTPRRPFDSEATAAWVVRCLICFNVVFSMQTLTDLMHLWGGMALPDGMHPREYARRGAYPLVATALLAAVFVLVTFRSGAVGQRWRAARLLVYVWLAQNALLVISALWRLSVYVEAYQMTRLRLAAGLWMGLVTFGIATIVFRIARQRSNAWLLRVNTLATAVLLVGACCVNFDRIIADYNVNAGLATDPGGDGENRSLVDVHYLEHIGYESLPGLHRLTREADEPIVRERAAEAIVRLESSLDTKMSDWRGWTWRRARIVSAVGPLVDDVAAADGGAGE